MELPPVKPHFSSPHSFDATSHVSEEARAFLQARLELLYRALFFLTSAFYALTTLAAILVVGVPWTHALVDPAYAFHLIGALMSLVFWMVCRKTPRSVRTLSWLDGAGLLGVLFLLKLDAYFDMDPLSLLLGTNGALISHAVIVPSSVRRTFWISLMGALPDGAVVALMALLHARAHSGSAVPTLDAVLWSAVAVFMATLVSHVIYGLRKEVQAARKLGQYTLLKLLGAGAMGEVYLASHALLRRRTAIKLLRADVDGHGLERFEREVQLTSQLTHPNTIAIYDYGRTADGLFYYVMEYLEGVDLDGLLAFSGPQSPARVIHILRQACGALEEAHGLGLLHRDIKPANLFLCRRRGMPDMVKVLDFGLVKEVGGSEEVTPQRVHMVVGTPLYMAPEAIVSPGRVDGRADLYSLGAVGYALLTGCHVFEGRTSVEICSHHLHTTPSAPSARLGRELPRDLCDVLLRCLAKHPDDRFANARELRTALEACADSSRWTEVDADLWWEANGSKVEVARPRKDPSALTGTQTLVTELIGRVA
ncbi:serine/threonine-protein kinase [Vitiosangium sp. GDMCC 1.1324]|uniref:serine/threonine-protein kinase n=1 Tax=Vitiosangium sp. (strain GDMCC 1.1324) TaxID=2138576 RepID=UPI000D36A269|nr:serine/threonine-protein kinase [Vitiosangium sp. GDMCC 1.1324]PTL80457.1 serine/threonine protein kinase [Vitiosangium sp. GDMCC 1.1324]